MRQQGLIDVLLDILLCPAHFREAFAAIPESDQTDTDITSNSEIEASHAVCSAIR